MLKENYFFICWFSYEKFLRKLNITKISYKLIHVIIFNPYIDKLPSKW